MMKKNFAKAAAIVMAAMTLVGMVPAAVSAHTLERPAAYTALRDSLQDDNPFGAIDLLIKHEVYHTASEEDFDEYTIVYFGSSSGKLVALNTVTKFKKEYGYTKESLETINVDEVFPEFSSLEFADYKVVDRENFVDFIVRFNDLDDMEHVRRLADLEYLILDNEDADYVTAESYMQDLESNGAEKVDSIDYEALELEFDID